MHGRTLSVFFVSALSGGTCRDLWTVDDDGWIESRSTFEKVISRGVLPPGTGETWRVACFFEIHLYT